MTPDDEVYEALLTSGLKGTMTAWPIKGAPPLPWFTYRRAKKGEFYADDHRYAKVPRYVVDLYQKDRDEDLVDRFEDALDLVGPFACDEKWIPAENCWITSYTVTKR